MNTKKANSILIGTSNNTSANIQIMYLITIAYTDIVRRVHFLLLQYNLKFLFISLKAIHSQNGNISATHSINLLIVSQHFYGYITDKA